MFIRRRTTNKIQTWLIGLNSIALLAVFVTLFNLPPSVDILPGSVVAGRERATMIYQDSKDLGNSLLHENVGIPALDVLDEVWVEKTIADPPYFEPYALQKESLKDVRHFFEVGEVDLSPELIWQEHFSLLFKTADDGYNCRVCVYGSDSRDDKFRFSVKGIRFVSKGEKSKFFNFSQFIYSNSKGVARSKASE